MKVVRCYNCYRKGHRSANCKSELRCLVKDCGLKHNLAPHKAWQLKSSAVSLLTKNVSQISLLTLSVMVATDNSYFKQELNSCQKVIKKLSKMLRN
jgi:hypothetical protein